MSEGLSDEETITMGTRRNGRPSPLTHSRTSKRGERRRARSDAPSPNRGAWRRARSDAPYPPPLQVSAEWAAGKAAGTKKLNNFPQRFNDAEGREMSNYA